MGFLLVVVMPLMPLQLADGSHGGQLGGRVVLAPPQAVEVTVAVEKARETQRLLAALDECRDDLGEGERQRIASTVIRAAARYGFDPLFVQALVEVESTCSPTARSRAGALGLIQVRPATARAVAARNGIPFGGPEELMRPEVNVDVGLRYLVELEEKFDDPYLAVAAYNLGPARVASMSPGHARRTRYVRRVLSRYEGLLRDHAVTARS